MLPIYEMVETIILSYLSSGCTAGTFGSLTVSEDRTFTVQTSGKTFTARTNPIGWSVAHNGFEGIDADLLEAARLAVNH